MPSTGRLKYERLQRGWSQARVAELIGADAGNVSRWERGRSVPSPYFRERLCHLYDKTAQELGLWTEAAPDQEEEQGEVLHRGPGLLTLRAGDTALLVYPEAQPAANVPPVAARVVASLSYVFGWVTGLLVLLFHRSDRFVLFHSLQSLCFFGGVHLVVMLCVLSAPLTEHSALFTLLREICGPFAVLVGVIAWGVGIVQAARGKEFPLPLVGAWCQRVVCSLRQAQGEPAFPRT